MLRWALGCFALAAVASGCATTAHPTLVCVQADADGHHVAVCMTVDEYKKARSQMRPVPGRSVPTPRDGEVTL